MEKIVTSAGGLNQAAFKQNETLANQMNEALTDYALNFDQRLHRRVDGYYVLLRTRSNDSVFKFGKNEAAYHKNLSAIPILKIILQIVQLCLKKSYF